MLGLPNAAAFQDINPGRHEFGFWAGFSPSSPTLISTAQDRQFALLGLRYGFYFARSGPVTFQYTADFLPAAVVLQPWFGRTSVAPPAGPAAAGGRTPVAGFGFAPVGFKFNYGSRRLSPFAAITAGMIYTGEPVPITGPGTTRMNFMFDFGGGVQWLLPNRRSLMIGYKLHHISNANRAEVNPGVDSNVIFIGYSFLR